MFFPIHSAGVEGDERAVGAAHRSVVEDGVAEVGHIVEEVPYWVRSSHSPDQLERNSSPPLAP